MAKGFKVIPKETKKKEEWDIPKIKERVKGKQIVLHDNKKGERCKMVKAAELPPIKMNGGL